MKRAATRLALTAYRLAVALGLPSTRLGYRAYEALYLGYKSAIESGSVRRLQNYVQPGSTVVDLGANIGFFTLPFARWVGEGGRVVAVEPEARNYARLGARLQAAGLSGRVETYQGVVAERSGTFRLALNPNHPGDHRLSEAGEAVSGWSLDDLLKGHPGPRVSLVKIDVQGAELRVLKGASRTIAADRPALLIEVEPPVIAQTGGITADLIDAVAALDYEARIWTRKGAGAPVGERDLLAQAEASGKLDVLYLPTPRTKGG